jgi:hypothetical protein
MREVGRAQVCPIDQCQSFQDDIPMHLGIAWLTQGKSMGKGHAKRSRRTDFPSDFLQQLDGYRGDSAIFNRCCDQTHGLVAHGSYWHQQDTIHAILNQSIGDCWRGLADEFPRCSQ